MDPNTESPPSTSAASNSGKETSTTDEEAFSSQSEHSSVPFDGKDVSTPKHQDFTWITGNSDSLLYVGRIGVGASSGVHEVRNKETGQVYARKVVHINDHISIQDVMDERRSVMRLCHSNPDGNVVHVFDHGWLAHNQYYFFDMERCDFSLDDYIHQSWSIETARKVPNFANRDVLGPLAKLSQIYNIMIDISNGVAFMHGCGYVHRDLKPKNDAASNLGGHTERGRGSGIYREPALGDGTGIKTMILNKYDIWAIGAMFYQLIHEEPPFQGNYSEARNYVVGYLDRDPEDPFPLPIRLPAGLENVALLDSVSRIIRSTLDPRPSKRPSARELVKDFKMALMELLSDISGVMSLERAWNGRTIPTLMTPFDDELEGLGTPSGTMGEQSDSRPSLRGGNGMQTTQNMQNMQSGMQSMIPGRALGSILESLLGEVPDDSPLKELEETLSIRKRVLGPSHPKTLKSMRTLADQYSKLGYLRNGIAMYKERMEAASKIYKPEDPRLVVIKNDLALAYSKAKDFASAVKISEEINEILPLAFSPEDTNFLTMRYNLGYFYEFVGQLSKSAEIYEEVIRSYRESRGSRDNRTLTLALNGLESVYTRLGRYADALRVCKQILELQRQTVGPKSGLALWTMKVIARHYQSLRQTKDAIATYEQIFEIRQESKGPEHQTTLNALSDLAQAYIDDGQKDEAKTRLEEVLVLMKRVRGEEHPDTLDLRDNISLISLGGDIPAQDPNDDSLYDDLGDLALGS